MAGVSLGGPCPPLVKKGDASRKVVEGTSPTGEGSTKLTTAAVTYDKENGRGIPIGNKDNRHQPTRLTTAAVTYDEENGRGIPIEKGNKDNRLQATRLPLSAGTYQ